jgi:hypothetical protein
MNLPLKAFEQNDDNDDDDRIAARRPCGKGRNTMSEAEIAIGGVKLSQEQAMVVRMACSAMHSEMQSPDALGDDEHGRRMTIACRERMNEILPLLAASQLKEDGNGFNEPTPHTPQYPRAICSLPECACTGAYLCDSAREAMAARLRTRAEGGDAMKEPGKMLWDMLCAKDQMHWPWWRVADGAKADYARIESAIRADEAAKVRAENERLREALEPFTRSLEIQESEWRMRDWPVLRNMDRLAYAMVGDARRARAALEQKS